MLDITMPDGELVTNQYDSGGNVNHIDGALNGRPYAYLERLDYDRFEQRLFLKVGNGVETSYTYDPRNRRLSHLMAGSPGAKPMQDIAYRYDSVGNITELNDTAPIPKANEYGGPSLQHFAYDDLYRLVKADGAYTTAREVQNYQLAMQYDEIHNIVHKNQLHTVTKNGGTPRTELATTYDWGYTYQDRGQPQPHAPTHIGNRSFDYDANGNQAGWQNDDNGTRRVIVWDEDNRIREVQDPKHGAAFSYDDQGQRKLRKSQYGETAYINQFFSVRNGAIASTHVYAGTARIVTKVGAGTPVGKVTNIKGTGNLNPNDPIGGSIVVGDTATPGGMKRVGGGKTASSTTTATSGSTATAATSSNTGTAATASSFPGQGLEHRSDRANEVAQNTEKNKHLNGGDAGGESGAGNSNAGGNGNSAGSSANAGNNGASTGGGNSNTGTGSIGLGGGSNSSGTGNNNTNGGAGQGNGREFIYFYHPDHLGSTGYVTDEKALRYEHITYFPFGETWVQESTASWRVPYQFTSKEMDPETGLYYFGARYYDPRTSVWQSADPILGKYLPTGHKEKDKNLAGMGGVFNTLNLNLYAYSHQNPVAYKDPDGNETYSATRDLANFPIGSHGLTVIITSDKTQYGKFEGYFNEYTNVSGNVPNIKQGEKFYAAMLSGGPADNGGKLVKEVNHGLDPESMQELAGTYKAPWYQFWDQDLALTKVAPKNGETEVEADMGVLQRFENYKDNETYGAFATGEKYNCFGFREGLLGRPDTGSKNEPWIVDPGINKSIPDKDF